MIVTLDDVKGLVKQAVEAHPNRVNPHEKDSSSCAYTSVTGIHCIGGEVLDILGCELPGAGHFMNNASMSDLVEAWERTVWNNTVEFTPEALKYLCIAQCVFDGVVVSGGIINDSIGARRWSTAYRMLENNYPALEHAWDVYDGG